MGNTNNDQMDARRRQSERQDAVALIAQRGMAGALGVARAVATVALESACEVAARNKGHNFAEPITDLSKAGEWLFRAARHFAVDMTTPRERVYLAGRITKHGWRIPLLGGDARAATMLPADWEGSWPVLERKVLGAHDYVGPYFVGCDHGCGHGPATHGTLGVENNTEGGPGWWDPWECMGLAPSTAKVNMAIKDHCRTAIEVSTLVFAWITDLEAYGTLWELGYAAGRGKAVVIAMPLELKDAPWVRELWFAYTGVLLIFASEPGAALKAVLP